MLLYENGIYVLGSVHMPAYPSRKLERFVSHLKGTVWCEADGEKLGIPNVNEIYDYRCVELALCYDFLETTEEHRDYLIAITQNKTSFSVLDALYNIAYWLNSDYNGLNRARNKYDNDFQNVLLHGREQLWLDKVVDGDLLVVGALHIPGLVSEKAKVLMKTLDCIRTPTRRDLKQEEEKHDKEPRPVLGAPITKETQNLA